MNIFLYITYAWLLLVVKWHGRHANSKGWIKPGILNNQTTELLFNLLISLFFGFSIAVIFIHWMIVVEIIIVAFIFGFLEGRMRIPVWSFLEYVALMPIFVISRIWDKNT